MDQSSPLFAGLPVKMVMKPGSDLMVFSVDWGEFARIEKLYIPPGFWQFWSRYASADEELRERIAETDPRFATYYHINADMMRLAQQRNQMALQQE